MMRTIMQGKSGKPAYRLYLLAAVWAASAVLMALFILTGNRAGAGASGSDGLALAQQAGGLQSGDRPLQATPTDTPTATPTSCILNYNYTLSSGATVVPGTTDIGNHCDDCTTNITLP